jgi:DNA polymerase
VSDAGRLLRAHLLHQRALGGTEVFVARGTRAALLARVAALAAEPGPHAARAPARGSGVGTPTPDDGARERNRKRAPVPEPAAATDELRRLAREAKAGEIEALPDLATLRAVADSCTRCPLHESRTRPVFADGSPDVRVLCVGEAPGQREDETGLPFVGRAGQLLDLLLLSAGLRRSDVFICNVLKCRPPGNRNPLPEEIERCSPFLLRQLDLVDPEVVVAFGTFAARTLLGTADSLGRMREHVHEFRGRPAVVTYHPAALLRNPGWTQATWEDLQRVRALLDEGPAGAEAGGGAGRESSQASLGVDGG